MAFFVERFIMENNNSNKKEGFLQKFGDPLLSALKPLNNKKTDDQIEKLEFQKAITKSMILDSLGLCDCLDISLDLNSMTTCMLSNRIMESICLLIISKSSNLTEDNYKLFQLQKEYLNPDMIIDRNCLNKSKLEFMKQSKLEEQAIKSFKEKTLLFTKKDKTYRDIVKKAFGNSSSFYDLCSSFMNMIVVNHQFINPNTYEAYEKNFGSVLNSVISSLSMVVDNFNIDTDIALLANNDSYEQIMSKFDDIVRFGNDLERTISSTNIDKELKSIINPLIEAIMSIYLIDTHLNGLTIKVQYIKEPILRYVLNILLIIKNKLNKGENIGQIYDECLSLDKNTLNSYNLGDTIIENERPFVLENKLNKEEQMNIIYSFNPDFSFDTYSIFMESSRETIHPIGIQQTQNRDFLLEITRLCFDGIINLIKSTNKDDYSTSSIIEKINSFNYVLKSSQDILGNKI